MMIDFPNKNVFAGSLLLLPPPPPRKKPGFACTFVSLFHTYKPISIFNPDLFDTFAFSVTNVMVSLMHLIVSFTSGGKIDQTAFTGLSPSTYDLGSEVNEETILSCDAIHHERRILLKQEIERMVLFFTVQPSLLAPNIQMVFSALTFAQSEVLWIETEYYVVQIFQFRRHGPH
ncbi:hypothetical protein SSX86_016466 [Deinandra increscens subsp. villosa]|uniref:Uncharacterized protein n=1 Tax=Deinandra increscens subsp. villosa TaxID=3103831 RepID=A0AAP0GVP0_9ASTR